MNAISPSLDELFKKTKGRLFFEKGAGYLGTLLCKRGFKWTRDIPTAAISQDTLYWNPDWFLKLSPNMRVTVLAHELWHPGFLHNIRRGDRCPRLWNQAGDHVINNLLEDHGYRFENWLQPDDPDYRPEPWCKDPKYKGWSTDAVYDDLVASGADKDAPTGFGLDIIVADDVAETRDAAIADVVAATATARITGGIGQVPGEIITLIDEFLNPKLPWNVLLFNFFNALASDEYSYRRPNRRHEDPILPSMTGRTGLEHLVYMVDASGSITPAQEIRMHSEVKFIQEELRPERLSLVVFDTKIRMIKDFERDEPYDKIEFRAGGGTSLRDCWDYLRREQPTAVVVFTDLHVRIPENPGIPVVWVCVDNPDATVPYGQLIHLED